METSKRWTLNSEEWSKFFTNALTFLAPVALIYLFQVQGNLTDGLQASDFAITAVTAGAMILYVVNTAIDFFKKLTAGK